MAMFVEIKTLKVVRGGGLMPSQTWVPNVETISAGESAADFVALDGSRTQSCIAFCRGSLGRQGNDSVIALFNILKTARNDAVDVLLLETFNRDLQSQGGEQLETFPPCFKRASINSNLYPRVINVPVRQLSDSDIKTIPMLFEINQIKNVHVELTDSVLRYLIDAIHAVHSGVDEHLTLSAPPKRKRVRKSFTTSKLVRTNFQRGTISAKYRDRDGRVKRMTTKPKSLHDESAVVEAEQLLLADLQQEHHEIGSDGELHLQSALPEAALDEAPDDASAADAEGEDADGEDNGGVEDNGDDADGEAADIATTAEAP